MSGPNESSSGNRITEHLLAGASDVARARLRECDSLPTEEQKAMLRSLRELAADRPSVFDGLTPTLAGFLDDERSVRLLAVKLFGVIAEGAPDAVVPVVDALADRLADDEEFYFVRARAAEALGYVALADPEAVATPETLAELRVGLSFDEPEVVVKLAKALEHVALANPRRFRHQVAHLATHLDDEQTLVRYHLCTALVAIGCGQPAALADGRAALIDRLGDENAFVRGRGAEALGLLATADETVSIPVDDLRSLLSDANTFVVERARFAIDARTAAGASSSTDPSTRLGTVRDATTEIATEIRTPETDGDCQHCGLALPDSGPPMCPQCGAPR